MGRLPPYGWDFDETGSTLVTNEAEQAVIEQMRPWRAEGISLRAIAHRVTSLDTPPKRARHWHAKVVTSILAR